MWAKDHFLTTMKIDTYKICEIAKAAGQIILNFYDGDLDVRSKDDNSPVTQADIEADKFIVGELQKLYPEIPVLSEESAKVEYQIRKNWKELFIVDPLDGTKEFINKNGQFSVNIAYVQDGVPKEGVIYAPTLDTLYFTYENSAYREVKGKRAVLPVENTRKEYIVVASRSHQNKQTLDFIEQIRQKHPGLKIDNRGSSLKFCMLAEGSADEYPRFAPTSEWDTAAAHAILKRVGCTIIDIKTKKELIYNKENLLNPFFWAGKEPK